MRTESQPLTLFGVSVSKKLTAVLLAIVILLVDGRPGVDLVSDQQAEMLQTLVLGYVFAQAAVDLVGKGAFRTWAETRSKPDVVPVHDEPAGGPMVDGYDQPDTI